MNAKTKKIYLMTAGTLLPAFVAVGLHVAYHKKAQLGMSDILLFAGASMVGGYFTSKLV